MASQNLGQVSGLWIGTSAPTNTTLIWYDSTPAIRCHKVYSVTASAWVVLDQNVISAITYSELKNFAQNTGLTQGSWYKITDQGNILALAITSTKVQYVDVNNNFVIDDLAASATYIVTSSNLLIDDISGVWDATNKRLKFSFAETAHDGNTDNDFVFGKKQRGGVWSLAKYKLSALISAVTGNSVTWNKGIFFNFNSALNAKTDVAGGVVGKNTYDSEKATMNKNITNVAASNQAILNTAKNYTDSKVVPSEIYSKTLPSAPTSGTAIDIAQGDTLSGIITKIHRWITQFKVATGIKVSQNFVPASSVQPINNNDTVDSALRKVQKNLDDISSRITGNTIKTSSEEISELTDEPNPITKNDFISQALMKLSYWCKHITTERIVNDSISKDKMSLEMNPAGLLQVKLMLDKNSSFSSDIFSQIRAILNKGTGIGLGICIAEECKHSGFFSGDPNFYGPIFLEDEPSSNFEVQNNHIRGILSNIGFIKNYRMKIFSYYPINNVPCSAPSTTFSNTIFEGVYPMVGLKKSGKKIWLSLLVSFSKELMNLIYNPNNWVDFQFDLSGTIFNKTITPVSTTNSGGNGDETTVFLINYDVTDLLSNDYILNNFWSRINLKITLNRKQ